MRKDINLIILNYNGLNLLKECLPTIISAAANSTHNCKVSVLDNCSTDNSLEYIKSEFPQVFIYAAKKNEFLVSYNHLIKNLNDEIIVLLNNDIKLDLNFVDPIVEVFTQRKDAFMAGPKCWTFDKSQFEGSRTKLRFYFGFMQAFTRYPGYEPDMDKFGYSAAVGSVVAFSREKFLKLGGFDDLYLPGRVEDLDLCYRGWKAGWRGYYQPKSTAYHKSSAAFNEYFGKKSAYIMTYRNTFLFIWKNISGCWLLLEHIIFIIPRLLYSVLSLDFCLFIGFFKALPRFFRAVKKRKAVKTASVISDKEILRYVGF